MKELSNQKKNIISLIQNVFLGEEPDLIDLNAKKVCDLAKKHSIEYIIYLGLSNYNIPMDEGFVNHAKVVAAKSVNQTLELELIKKVFSSNNINFMPLKGSILQKMYPKIEYRNMADIDILVRDSYFPRLKERRKQTAGTLSGGEQQMLAMGRALMSRPKLMLLDEPSMGLSPLLVTEIFAIIQRLHEAGTTILLVEQNAALALKICHRAAVMETGRIVLSGTGEELSQSPEVQKAYLGG